jgi:diguanylate cyclase (GGDEF)-like protein/PAS domain S-box-containing protein
MTTANFIFSLFLFFGLFSFAGASLLLIQFRRNRVCYVTYWAIGAFSICIGVVGIALSPVLPEWMSYKLANGFTFAAAILFNYSLSCLSGKNTPPKWVAFNSVAMAVLLIGGLILVSDHFGPRYQPALVAVVTAIASFYGFILIYKYYQQSKIYLAAVLSFIYLIGALVWSIRAVMVLYFNIGFAHEGGSSNAISFVVLLLLGILRFMIFAGLVMAIADQDREQLAAELHEQRISIANQNTTNSEEKLRHVLNATGEGIWDWNILTGEVKHNQRWIELLGEDPEQTYFSVEDFKNRIHPEDLSLVLDRLNVSLATGKEYQAQYRMVRGDGCVVWMEDKGAIVERSESGEPLRMVGAITDISNEKAAQEKIQELIFFDSLTKLPNRQYIQDRIARTINESIRNKTHSGLMYLDLDNFKNINDSYGHNVGDVLLKAFGARIQNAIRPKDVVARIGGDEYLILFEEIGATGEDAKAVLEDAIERVLGTFSEHFDLGHGIYVHAKASIGVVIFGHELNQIDDILKFADLAMYAAKVDPHNSHRFFDLDLMTKFNHKNEYLLQLRDACKQKQLFAVYQPVVDRHQEVVAYEALARWHHPNLGIVLPDDFIPFAEKNALIIEVGNAVMDHILNDQTLWSQSTNRKPFDVLINISAHQLMNLGFAKKFIASCEQFHVPINRIHFEITESVYLENVDMAIEVMDFLNKQGIQFALDDFGTGFSSLTYLQKLPIQYLKIDKSFVAGLGVSADDEAIASNVLRLARGLGIKVIAEGVETQSQFEWLYSSGCDFFQGWYFGQPSEGIEPLKG